MRLLWMLPWWIAAGELAAQAAPAWRRGDAESAVESVTETNGRVELRVRATFDPQDVSKVLGRALSEGQILVDGLTIIVDGAPASRVKTVLADAQVERSVDDIDALLMDIQKPGGADEGSGSSIRARRELAAETSTTDAISYSARVATVRRQRFPLVLVGVEIASAPEDAPLAPGDRAVVLPRVRSRGGIIDPSDPQSKQNIGAWYVRPGDEVKFRLEPRPDGQRVWVAATFERPR